MMAATEFELLGELEDELEEEAAELEPLFPRGEPQKMAARRRLAAAVRLLEEDFGLAEFFPKVVLDTLGHVGELAAVVLAIISGSRDENKLADLLFFGRHPGRGRGLLNPGDPGADEWRKIRDDIVRPQLFKRFFAEYDLRTKPGDPVLGLPANTAMTPADRARRETLVLTLFPVLVNRADARRNAAIRGSSFVGNPIPLALRGIAIELSQVQIELIREFFTSRAMWQAFQQAFEQFANGELRNPLRGKGAQEPDSAAYFLFAEFAWLCVESDVHKAFWQKAVTTFVKTQEIFVNVYKPTPSSPTNGILFNRYSNENFDSSRQFTEAEKQLLRTKYDGMTLNQLREAAAANMRQAQSLN